jgi:hypothetical protein
MPDDQAIRTVRRRRTRLGVDAGEIADRVVKFFEADQQSRVFDISARLQREAKLRMWTEPKDWPWENASNFPTPDMMTHSLSVQDTLHNAVMMTRPVIGAKPIEKRDTEKARVIDNLLDYQFFVEQQGEDIVGDIIQNFVNDGVVTCFVPWVREFAESVDVQVFPPIPDDVMPVEYFATILAKTLPEHQAVPSAEGWDFEILPARDGPLGKARFYTRVSGEVELVLLREVLAYDGPRVIPKAYEDVLYPTQAANLQAPSPSNPGGAAHVILVDYPTVDEVVRLAKSGRYDFLDRDAIEHLKSGKRDDSWRNLDRQKDDLAGREAEASRDTVDAASHKPLTRLLCFDRYDIDGDGRDEDVVWYVLKETKQLLRARRMTEDFPSDPPRRPLAGKAFLPVTGRYAGISLPELLEGTHDALKAILDQGIDFGTVTNAPFFFYRASAALRPETIRLWPGEGYPLSDPSRDVFFPQFGNRDQTFAFNMVSLLTQMQEKLSEVGDIQQGRVPPGRSSALRTAGGIAMLLGQGEARPERILRRFFGLLAEVFHLMHDLDQVRLPPAKQILVGGIQKDGENPFLTIDDREAIRGRFLYEFRANVLNASKTALTENLEALMSVYVNELYVQLGLIDAEGIYRLGRDYGRARGQDPDQYIKAPSPQAQEDRVFAEEAVNMIIAGSLPRGVPAEAGGAAQHLAKLMEISQRDEFGLLSQQQLGIFAAYLAQVKQNAVAEQQAQAAAQAAGQFQVGGQPTAGQATPAMPAEAPLGPGELKDETLPGAGGGGAQAQV